MPEVPIPKEKWSGKIGTVSIGATGGEGGTRGKKTVIGGETSMPFHFFEGSFPNRPLIAGEIIDTVANLHPLALEPFADVAAEPDKWAKRWVEEYHADLICLKLHSTNPGGEDRSPEEAAQTVKRVLEAVDVPLIIYGSGQEEKDAKLMEVVSSMACRERLLIGHAEEGAYKTIAAAAMANDHALISFSNLDINLAKQINILLSDFGVKLENIVLDPLMAGLGMGLEYSYSVNERIRLAALMGDRMLQVPMICDVSSAWEAREATDDSPEWGDVRERAAWWEATTGLAALLSGADLLIVRSPRAAIILREAISELRGGD